MVARSGSTILVGLGGIVLGLAAGLGMGMFTSTNESPTASAEGSTKRSGDDATSPRSLEAPSIENRAPSAAGDTADSTSGGSGAARAEVASEGGVAAGTATITGRVIDSEGKGLAGVAVRSNPMFDADEGRESTRGKGFEPIRSLDEEVQRAISEYKKNAAARAEAVTDADGRYELKGVSAGRNWVTAARDGLVFDATGSSYAKGGETLDFVATSVVEVPIEILLPDGSPAQRANLRVDTERMRTSPELWTSAKPRIVCKPGSYTLRAEIVQAQFKANGITEECASPATPVEISADHNEKITLKLESRTGIRGTVLPSPDLVAGQNLRVRCVDLPANGEFDPKKLGDSNDGSWTTIGGTFEFFDLKPGRKELCVFVEWRGAVIHHQPVDVKPGVSQVSIDLSKIDTSKFVLATLTDAGGKPVKGDNFSAEIQSERNSRSSEISSLERRDRKVWLVPDSDAADYLAGKKVGAKMTLDIQTQKYGMKKVDVAPGTRTLDVKFEKPAYLEVTIAGYPGSPYEGKINVSVQKADGESGRRFYYGGDDHKVKPDGTIKLGPEAPGDYMVVMTARNSDENQWEQTTLVNQKITLVEGTNRVTLAIPSLSKLTVVINGEAAGQLYMMSIPAGDYKSAEITDGKAVFENLAPGEYQVTYQEGEKIGSAKVRIPDTSTVTLTPSEPNALAVFVEDTNGALAKAGFHNDDMIIGVDGKEFEGGSMMAFASIASKEKSKVVVLRDGKKIELEIAGRDLLRKPGSMGGTLMPTTR